MEQIKDNFITKIEKHSLYVGFTTFFKECIKEGTLQSIEFFRLPWNIKESLYNNCHFCSSFKQIEIHHIIRKKIGGLDDENNLIPLCRSCHQIVHKWGNKLLYTNKKWFLVNERYEIIKRPLFPNSFIERDFPEDSFLNYEEKYKSENTCIIFKEMKFNEELKN